MAVRSFNPLEQHAGKIFLAVVAVITLILAYLYVFGDPVKVLIGGAPRSVAEARQGLSAQTKDLRNKIAPGAPIVGKVIEPSPGLEKVDLGQASQIATLPFNGIGQPVLVQQGIQTREPVYLALYAAPPAPTRPQLVADRKVVTEPDKADLTGKKTISREINHVTVAIKLPVAQLTRMVADKQQEAKDKSLQWQASTGQFVVCALKIERKELDDNGLPVDRTAQPIVSLAPGAPGSWDKACPLPDPKDIAKFNEWPAAMFGPAPAGKESYFDTVRRAQAAIFQPKLPGGIKPEVAKDIADLVKELPPPVPAPGTVPGGNVPVPPVRPMPPVGGPPTVGGGEPPAAAPAPEPIVLLPVGWGIDDKVESNHAYIYRVAVVYLNPLGGSWMVADKDRNVVTLESEWSEWSQPIRTERDLYGFVLDTRGNAPNITAEVTVYRKVNGWWFKRSFTARPGETVGGKLMERRLPTDKEPVEVDFNTGMRVVDVRFDQDILVRSVENGQVIDIPTKSTQVLLVDPKGQLRLRSLGEDIQDPDRKKLDREIVEQPRAKTAPPAAPTTPVPGGPVGPPPGGRPGVPMGGGD
ncbi:MAG: hypothetical protein PHU85_05310 [Phycisphaerae bacterium]|nr:hypothetical protein [Phycisphaerae bacterium]